MGVVERLDGGWVSGLEGFHSGRSHSRFLLLCLSLAHIKLFSERKGFLRRSME